MNVLVVTSADVITLSITRFEGLGTIGGSGDPLFENNGMDIWQIVHKGNRIIRIWYNYKIEKHLWKTALPLLIGAFCFVNAECEYGRLRPILYPRWGDHRSSAIKLVFLTTPKAGRPDLITLCSILRIPVCMHNVPEEKIFRPAAWNAFGMDKEGQDYRACATYSPMYK